MSREDLLIKLHRMIQGQVKSYISDHPDHFAPYAIPTAPKSLAKRIAHELIAKGLVFDPKQITTLKAAAIKREQPRPPQHQKRPFEVAYKKRRHF